MLASLLRLPSPNLPADLLTGDARLDSHLRALDAALAGAASVRRHTVMEARDFLLEARDHARAEGLSAEAAANRAIEALGEITAIAAEQRARLASLFWKAGLAMGVSYATLMLGFSLLGGGAASSSPTTLAIVFALQALFFGGVMGYFTAYVFQRAEPRAADSDGPGHFRVAYTLTGIRISYALVIAFTLSAAIVGAGLFGVGPFADASPWWMVALLLVNLRVVLTALRGAWFRGEVQDDRVTLDGLGGHTTIARSAITAVRRDPPLMQLLIPGFGLSWCITWQDGDGRTRRTRASISNDLVHGDRLVAWLEDAARANAPRRAATA